jgi:hypothetical protein
MTNLATNFLSYRDNLDILPRYLPDAAVNLVYLDAPDATDAQLLAFEDTRHACPSAEATNARPTNTARHEGRVPHKVS